MGEKYNGLVVLVTQYSGGLLGKLIKGNFPYFS